MRGSEHTICYTYRLGRTRRCDVQLEILYFDGCPDYRTAEETLRGVLAEQGIGAEVELVAVNTDEEANRLRFPGSPTVRVDGEDVMAEGDQVAARVVMRGTHLGEFQRIAPTGKRVEVKAIDMFRISNGKIVEPWGHADDPTGFLCQSECS